MSLLVDTVMPVALPSEGGPVFNPDKVTVIADAAITRLDATVRVMLEMPDADPVKDEGRTNTTALAAMNPAG